jgi:hypothetical protein
VRVVVDGVGNEEGQRPGCRVVRVVVDGQASLSQDTVLIVLIRLNQYTF